MKREEVSILLVKFNACVTCISLYLVRRRIPLRSGRKKTAFSYSSSLLSNNSSSRAISVLTRVFLLHPSTSSSAYLSPSTSLCQNPQCHSLTRFTRSSRPNHPSVLPFTLRDTHLHTTTSPELVLQDICFDFSQFCGQKVKDEGDRVRSYHSRCCSYRNSPDRGVINLAKCLSWQILWVQCVGTEELRGQGPDKKSRPE